MRRADSFEKTWCWERLRAGGEGSNRGRDGWMASPTRWTWVWANTGDGEGQGSLACCSPWGRKSWPQLSDWTAKSCQWRWVFTALGIRSRVFSTGHQKPIVVRQKAIPVELCFLSLLVGPLPPISISVSAYTVHSALASLSHSHLDIYFSILSSTHSSRHGFHILKP